MTTNATEIASVDGGTLTLSAADLDGFASQVQGPILRRGDEGWDDAILIWNGMVANQPALILQPTSAADVAAAVRFAAEHGILVSIKGGGHNIAGTAMAPNGLTLEMSRMKQVTVDAGTRTVNVGPGCKLGEIDAVTQEQGLAAVLGFISETGVAGLTVGGGLGYLTRRFGWTVDTLTEVEVVTADGQIRIANRQENEDLFWALRGGGGNFGFVTRFTFRLFEVGPMVTGGLIVWTADRAPEVLATYKAITETAPRELTAVCTVRLAPPAPFLPPEVHGKPITGIVVCHTGPNAADDIAPIRALGSPVVDLITEKPYTAQQSMLDATQPKGLHYYWKTEFLPGLTDDFLETFRTNALTVTSPLSQSVMFHLAGAVNEFAEDDGAVGNRDAAFFTAVAGCWPPGDERASEHVAWVRDSWAQIQPFSTGGNYVNFQVADETAERTAAAYRGNFERLRQLKATWDPNNLFRMTRNVSPAS